MKIVLSALSAGLMALTATADIVTNDYFNDISSPTTLSGVTNIIAKTRDVNITADLTLDNKTFLWFKGDSGTGYVNLAPTANDVTLTIKGNSALYTTYRYSGTDSGAWKDVGIDPVGKKDNVPGCYRVRLGTEGGDSGSTGRVRILPEKLPNFGSNGKTAFWSRYLYVSSSVSPDPDTGMIDFLELPSGTQVDVEWLETQATAYPTRILFKGGILKHNNACNTGNPFLAPLTGTTLVLEGVGTNPVYVAAQFLEQEMTGKKGGTLKFRGKDVRLNYTGRYRPGSTSGRNNFPWSLSANDNVVWEQTGDLILGENIHLRTLSDNVLPHGEGTGGLVLYYNAQVTQASTTDSTLSIAYATLDLYGTEQQVNSLTSASSESYRIGVVSNTHETATGTLILGADNVNGKLNAKCTANVTVKKQGTSTLTVTDTTAEQFNLEAGRAVFAGTTILTNLSIAADTEAAGPVEIRSSLTVASDAQATGLRLTLDDGATMSVDGTLSVRALTVAGTALAAGSYTGTDWLTHGTVTVLEPLDATITDVSWTGAGATTSASLKDNWSDGKGAFSTARGRPVFATAGTEAVLDNGLSAFRGAKFDAPGDFTVVTNGASDSLNLFGALEVAGASDEATATKHAYTLAAPTRMWYDQTVTLASNLTVTLAGLTSYENYGLELKGVKLSDNTYDYSEGGRLILENPRISGPITHKLGGGWLVLRGDVGNPGDTAALVLDYIRYRNSTNKTDGLLNGGLTRLENATIWKPVKTTGHGQVGGLSSEWFVAAAGSSNVFEEAVSFNPTTTIRGEANAVYVFKDSVTVTSGGFLPTSNATQKRTKFVFNGPVVVTAKSRAMNPSFASLVFNATGNSIALAFQCGASDCTMGVDDAFDETGFLMDGDAGIVQLGTTHQKMKYLVSGKMDQTNNNGYFVKNPDLLHKGTITGSYPSAVEITYGAPDAAAASVTNCGVQFTGWVKLEKSGAGYHRMLAMEYNSYGDIEVSGGTLAFDSDASWTNGTNVTVKGTGTLKTGSAGTFNKNCIVTASGDNWKMDLTGIQKAKSFIVDGVTMPAGDYTSSHATLGSHFTGTGTLHVKGGLFIMFR